MSLRQDRRASRHGWSKRKAPSQIVAAHGKAGDEPTASRPLCVVTLVARYKGAGSIDEAASFVCENRRARHQSRPAVDQLSEGFRRDRSRSRLTGAFADSVASQSCCSRHGRGQTGRAAASPLGGGTLTPIPPNWGLIRAST